MQTLTFSWEPFYNELAWKLLNYKNNRKSLIDIVIKSFYENGISMPKMENGEMVDLDPFTTFGIFNRQITDDKRIKIANSLKKYLSVETDAPTTFEGIPVLNNQNATYYYFIGDRKDNDIDDLWELFAYALHYSKNQSKENEQNFIKYFDLCVNKKGNGNSKISMALFWICPSFYLNLDSRNVWYIYDSNQLPDSFVKSLPVFKSNKKTDGTTYLAIVNKLHEFVNAGTNGFNDFKMLSHEAWRYANQVNEEIKEQKKMETEDTITEETEDTVRYWIYSPGENSFKWDEYYKNGVMGIGWGDIGDLSLFKSKNDMRLAITEKVDPSTSNKNAAHATWQFVHEMKPGDIIFVKKGMYKLVGRGVVESDYYFDDSVEDSYKNLRKVNWTHNGEWAHPGQAVMKTLTDITSYTEYVKELSQLFQEEDDVIIDEPVKVNVKDYSKEKFLSEVYISEKEYTNICNLLKLKKNIILQGAPGVGKTYTAKRLAYSLLEKVDTERVQMVQFHQSYSYEDFIEGYRPTEGSFKLSKGIFYNFCKKAAEDDKENKYYFIIDEINRGNLSKIFGELFMLIESDKRNQELPLLYSGDKFKVPSNVYIIGLMNTADRSLAMLDYALRRRFAFYTMNPGFDTEGFISYKNSLNNEKFNKLIYTIEQLNKEIANDESLGEGFEIGHSYFCNYKEMTEDILYNIIEYELIPLLKEYWFDEPSKVRDWSNKLRGNL